jgi:hypothetical protein
LREERRLRVFENRLLRRIFGPKRLEVTGELRNLHNEKLNGLYCSPNIVRVIKSRRNKWVGHVESMGKGEAYTEISCEEFRKRDHLQDPGLDGRTILKWIFRMWNMDWIELAQDRDSWWALVNAVIKLPVP